TEVPQLDDDGRSVTLTYDEVFVDWEIVFWSGVTPGMPAHVAGGRALGVDDPREAKDAVVEAIRDGDEQALAAVADFWNSAYMFEALPDDPALYLSSGAYVISELVAGSHVTLVRNPLYTWG